MAQKINANLFRKSLQNSEWTSKYQNTNKEETSLFIFKNIKIEKYITNLFRFYGFFITSYQIDFYKSQLKIYISFIKNPFYKNVEIKKTNKKLFYKHLTKTFLITVLTNYYNVKVNLKLKDLTNTFENNLIKFKSVRMEHRKLLKNLRRFKNYDNFLGITKLIFIVLSNRKSTKLLSNFMSYLISIQKKKHYHVLIFIKNILNIVLKSKLSKILGIKIQISGRINNRRKSKRKVITLGNLPIQSLNSYIDYTESKSYTKNGTFGIKVWICEKR